MIWLTLLIIVSPASHAAEPLNQVNQRCHCASAGEDPYEEKLAFTTGSHKGKCIDLCRFRRAVLVSQNGRLRVANVLHKGRFMTAEFDPHASYEIDMLFERLFTGVSHVAFRLRFPADSPVALQPQAVTSETSNDFSHDLVISVEATLPENEGFASFAAYRGDFLLSYRITTIEEARRWMIDVKKHTVNQYQLNVPKDALAPLIELAVKRSEEKTFNTPYYLLTANCSSSFFAMLDEVMRTTPPTGFDWSERAWPIWGPYGTLHYLSSRGIVAQQLPELKDDRR